MTSTDVIPYIPQTLLFCVYWLAAIIVLAEALNKLQRTDPLRRGLRPMERLSAVLNVLGWMLFAVASAGAIVSPVLISHAVRLQDAALMLGLAVFVIHRRLKEIGATHA